MAVLKIIRPTAEAELLVLFFFSFFKREFDV